MKVQIIQTDNIDDFKIKLSEYLNQGYKIQNSNISVSNKIDNIPQLGGQIIDYEKIIYFAILIKE